MSALLHFLIWAALIFLMMRFGCGAHVTGHGPGDAQSDGTDSRDRSGMDQLRWVPPAKDTDPVCDKTINTDGAKSSVHDGTVYYFCSRDCREVFEAAPRQYVGSNANTRQSQLEHSYD
jgi:YHS domain-containing protein